MKRVNIVVEGQTERDFVESLMRPYLQQKGIIFVDPIVIRTSKSARGGFVKYSHLKNDILIALRSTKQDLLVTTMVDFFRIPGDLPNSETWTCIEDHKQRAKAMESAIDNDIKDNRFFSYIQLHEFEALLFSSTKGYDKYLDKNTIASIEDVIKEFANPEDINTNPDLAPSKRLKQFFHPDYDKIVYGNTLALQIGMSTILKKCPRFRTWIEKIISEATK